MSLLFAQTEAKINEYIKVDVQVLYVLTHWQTLCPPLLLRLFLKGPANLFSLLSPRSLGVKPGLNGSCSEWKHLLSGKGVFFWFVFYFSCVSAAATELALLFSTENPFIILYPILKQNKTNIAIALSYIFGESWEVSSALLSNAFPQCSTALVCLRKYSFNIHHQRLQTVNKQREGRCFGPARVASFNQSSTFFSGVLSAWAPTLFTSEQRRLLIFKQPTSPNALHRIRLTSP